MCAERTYKYVGVRETLYERARPIAAGSYRVNHGAS
jgi:hypothetical protein